MGRLPDFLIIGASRSGTSSLFSNLLKHPRIRGPNIGGNKKEVHFFDKKINRGYDLKWYKNRFRDPSADCVFFESTPNYLFVPIVPKLISDCVPRAKFIVMLRNPVNRAWSHFFHWRNKCGWNTGILRQKGHDVVKKGIYWEQLERWFEYFDREQFLIIKSEEFYRLEKEVIIRCFKFLGLERFNFDKKSIIYWDPKRDYLVSRKKYESPPANVVNWLRNFYAPHNAKLEELLDRKFNWD